MIYDLNKMKAAINVFESASENCCGKTQNEKVQFVQEPNHPLFFFKFSVFFFLCVLSVPGLNPLNRRDESLLPVCSDGQDETVRSSFTCWFISFLFRNYFFCFFLQRAESEKERPLKKRKKKRPILIFWRTWRESSRPRSCSIQVPIDSRDSGTR